MEMKLWSGAISIYYCDTNDFSTSDTTKFSLNIFLEQRLPSFKNKVILDIETSTLENPVPLCSQGNFLSNLMKNRTG